jgi:hypothetical protein
LDANYFIKRKMQMIQKSILLSVILSNLLVAQTLQTNEDATEYKAPRLAGDSLAIKPLTKIKDTEATSAKDIFSKGNIKGLLRYSTQLRDTSYDPVDRNAPAIPNSTQGYSAFGGYLGYETATFYNISAGATFYTAQPLFNNDFFDGTLGGLADGSQGYTALGEAFVKFKTKEHDARIGRREMPDYRFISLSNIRFSPITHQGATYENKMLKDTKFVFAYIDSQKNRNAEDFTGMVRAARVKEQSGNRQIIRGDYNPADFNNPDGEYQGKEKAMYMLGTTLNKDSFSLELWDYYVEDFVNTIYLYGDYNYRINKNLSLSLAGQYAKQDNVGDHVSGNIDSWFYGVKAQLAWKSGTTLFLSHNQVAYNENSYDGGTIFVRWGTPQMFNSFQVQDSELAGTQSYGVGAQFELGHMGIIPNTVIRFRHAYYNMPDKLWDYFAAQDRSETTFDLRYSFTKNDGFGIFTQMKGLSVQFRIAYNDFNTDYNFEQYTQEHGFSFEKVTKDFIDSRLYVDYLF